MPIYHYINYTLYITHSRVGFFGYFHASNDHKTRILLPSTIVVTIIYGLLLKSLRLTHMIIINNLLSKSFSPIDHSLFQNNASYDQTGAL